MSFPQSVRSLRCGCGPVLHGYSSKDVDPATAIDVVFIDREGMEHAVKAPPGKHLLEIAHANDIDLEGACEGSLACSTCHVYIDDESFEKLDEPCDDENDMLDLAFGLAEKYVRSAHACFAGGAGFLRSQRTGKVWVLTARGCFALC